MTYFSAATVDDASNAFFDAMRKQACRKHRDTVCDLHASAVMAADVLLATATFRAELVRMSVMQARAITIYAPSPVGFIAVARHAAIQAALDTHAEEAAASPG